MPQKIIIDTDPGQDDAIAILMALASPDEIEVLGITAVAGNAALAFTEKNARRICELAGRPDIPVHAGCLGPLVGKLVTAEHVHGPTGLDGPDLPEPDMPLATGHAVPFLIETVMASEPGSVTLATLGPLTNVAMALRQEPALAGRLGGIVAMGGAYFEVGNVTPAAEFNIWVDPEAADIVLKSGVEVTLLPLDVTHKLLVTRERIARIAALGTRPAEVVAQMVAFSERFDLDKYGSDGAPLHDPTVIAYLLKPELFSGRHINVEIELASPLTRGMTVADWWRVSKRPANALFIRDVDADGFFDLLTERLGRLG